MTIHRRLYCPSTIIQPVYILCWSCAVVTHIPRHPTLQLHYLLLRTSPPPPKKKHGLPLPLPLSSSDFNKPPTRPFKLYSRLPACWPSLGPHHSLYPPRCPDPLPASSRHPLPSYRQKQRHLAQRPGGAFCGGGPTTESKICDTAPAELEREHLVFLACREGW